MAKGIDQVCGETRTPRRSVTRPRHVAGRIKRYIDRIQPHMHLLGVEFTMVLDPGTPQAKTILNVPKLQLRLPKGYNVAPIR